MSRHHWACTHCHTPLAGEFDSPQPDDKPAFCCDGCRFVYQIIYTHQLDEYYMIKKEAVMLQTPRPVTVNQHEYAYLDDDVALEKYAVGQDRRQMDFYLEGIHCVACLWLVERLNTMVPGVKSTRLDLSRSVLRVHLNDEGSFAEAASMLEQIGYPPHPLARDDDANQYKKRDDRRLLLQLGTAGFCAGNIMLLFISIYSGVADHLLTLFLWLGFFLILPVMTFSASSFYQSALGALRAGQLNIDVPVSFALIGGFVASTYHLFIGSHDVYYDSLAMFVFLLLGTRILLRGLHQRTDQSMRSAQWLMPSAVLRCADEHSVGVLVPLDRIEVDDIVRVEPDHMIPVDGTVIGEAASVDVHLLTGESAPVNVQAGDAVFAGTMNRDKALLMRVTAIKEDTRLSTIMDQIQHAQKPAMVTMADGVAKWFLLVITLASLGVFIYFFGHDMGEGIRRALALIIIACPCALALATPLAYTLGMRLCADIGALLKGPEVLERLALTCDVLLDKTGTITHGQFKVIDWIILDGSEDLYDVALALEEDINHPIASAIRDYAIKQDPFLKARPLFNKEETVGQGVSARDEKHVFRIGRLREGDVDVERGEQTQIGLYCDDVCAVRIYLGDQIRDTSQNAVQTLHQQGHHVAILSGDLASTVDRVATSLSIDEAQGALMPEQKQSIVKERNHAMMVGDGANDAAALANAFVSVAVSGSLEVSFRSADVYLSKPGVAPLPSLLAIARKTRTVVKRNLKISLIYNALGLTAALLGWVTPLAAAILMPISSLTVLLSSFLGLSKKK